MLSRVTANNVGDVFWDTLYICQKFAVLITLVKSFVRWRRLSIHNINNNNNNNNNNNDTYIAPNTVILNPHTAMLAVHDNQ